MLCQRNNILFLLLLLLETYLTTIVINHNYFITSTQQSIKKGQNAESSAFLRSYVQKSFHQQSAAGPATSNCHLILFLPWVSYSGTNGKKIKTKNQHLYVTEDGNSKSLYIVFLGNGHNNKSSRGGRNVRGIASKLLLPIPIFGAKITNKKKKEKKTCL